MKSWAQPLVPHKLDMVHSCNPRTLEAKAGGSNVQGHGSVETSQVLGALAILAKDQDLVSSTHNVAHQAPMAHTGYTYIHAGKIFKHRIFKKF